MSSRARLTLTCAWLVALALGAWHLWHGRYQITGDGVSYLDIGEALVRGDWATALTAYWSPLYPAVLGLAIRAVQPTPASEFAVVAVVNFLVYVTAIAAFHYLLTEILRLGRQVRPSGEGVRVSFPDWACIALGYAVFVWVSLQLIAIWNVAPDMALSAIVYLCVGLLLRIRAGDTRWKTMGALGAALGAGYLIKAPMFVLAPVFLVCAGVAMGHLRRAIPRVAVAAICFAVVAGPYVLAISIEKRRFTFSDSGRINAAWDVNGVPKSFWQGGPASSGRPIHATRKIHATPDVYEFTRSVHAAYPLWHDPSYWYDGVTPYFDAQGLKRPLGESRTLYVRLVREQAPFVLGVLVFPLFGTGLLGWWRGVIAAWPLWVPAAAGLGMFTIAGAESRYVAPFIALAMMAGLASVQLRPGRVSRLMLIGLTAVVLTLEIRNLVLGVQHVGPMVETAHIDAEVSRELVRLGVGPGDRVALLRPARGVYWSRLARVQIVAEIHRDSEPDFWAGGDEQRREVLRLIAGTGARAVVSAGVAGQPETDGWIPLGATGWHAYPLAAYPPEP